MRAALLAAAVLCGCVEVSPFVCDGDGQCGSDGICEAAGFCSFPAAGCISGRSYGEHAGAELAGTCVGGNPTSPIVEIRAGSDHSCAREQRGAVWCWGRNQDGAVGDGTMVDRDIPTAVLELGDAIAIAAGELHTCAIDSDGKVWCWGFNEHGQLGDGTRADRTRPVGVAGLPGAAVQLGLGEYHSCARLESGQVWCWGLNDRGQLGRGAAPGGDSAVPVQVRGLENAVELEADGFHACARTSSSARCWGKNQYGQLGLGGALDDVPAPIIVGWLDRAVSIAAGGEHTCGVFADQTVACTGRNQYGQLGDGTTDERHVPVPVRGLDDVVEVSGGEWFTCARTSTGAIYCWGRSDRGELGDGTEREVLEPDRPVVLAAPAAAVSAGERHACALTSDGCVLCWGLDEYGQLGAGGVGYTSTPVQVPFPCAAGLQSPSEPGPDRVPRGR